MKDFTMGGFVAGCITSGIAFIILFANWGRLLPVEGFDSLLFGAVGYIAALVGYFGYMAKKKSNEEEGNWNSSEIGAGFFASLIALWTYIPIVIFFEW